MLGGGSELRIVNYEAGDRDALLRALNDAGQPQLLAFNAGNCATASAISPLRNCA